MNRSAITHRRLLMFKWLMVFVPAVTLIVGHSLLGRAQHRSGESMLVTLPVAFLALVLSYVFAETMFKVLRGLQAETLAREHDILTLNAVMRERERLSRELHDGSAQLVADLLLRLDTIKELVEAGRPQEAEAELERLHGVADEIYKDIGESITGLRTNVTERGLVRALQDYADQFEERHRIPVSLRTDNAADRLPSLAAFQVFRLVQEALTNVRKHARARQAIVTLTSDGSGQLEVVIADDGHGISPGPQRNGPDASGRPPSTSSGRGLGLTSMRERVEALGGTFHVSSQPGSGTQVIAIVPIPRTRRENGRAALAAPAG